MNNILKYPLDKKELADEIKHFAKDENITNGEINWKPKFYKVTFIVTDYENQYHMIAGIIQARTEFIAMNDIKWKYYLSYFGYAVTAEIIEEKDLKTIEVGTWDTKSKTYENIWKEYKRCESIREEKLKTYKKGESKVKPNELPIVFLEV